MYCLRDYAFRFLCCVLLRCLLLFAYLFCFFVFYLLLFFIFFFFFFSSRRRHTRCLSDWSSDVCSSDLVPLTGTSVIAFGSLGIFAISLPPSNSIRMVGGPPASGSYSPTNFLSSDSERSEERRVGKECVSVWASCRWSKIAKVTGEVSS